MLYRLVTHETPSFSFFRTELLFGTPRFYSVRYGECFSPKQRHNLEKAVQDWQEGNLSSALTSFNKAIVLPLSENRARHNLEAYYLASQLSFGWNNDKTIEYAQKALVAIEHLKWWLGIWNTFSFVFGNLFFGRNVFRQLNYQSLLFDLHKMLATSYYLSQESLFNNYPLDFSTEEKKKFWKKAEWHATMAKSLAENSMEEEEIQELLLNIYHTTYRSKEICEILHQRIMFGEKSSDLQILLGIHYFLSFRYDECIGVLRQHVLEKLPPVEKDPIPKYFIHNQKLNPFFLPLRKFPLIPVCATAFMAAALRIKSEKKNSENSEKMHREIFRNIISQNIYTQWFYYISLLEHNIKCNDDRGTAMVLRDALRDEIYEILLNPLLHLWFSDIPSTEFSKKIDMVVSVGGPDLSRCVGMLRTKEVNLWRDGVWSTHIPNVLGREARKWKRSFQFYRFTPLKIKL